MATVPLSGTQIRLLHNVPFSNDYKNTRWFDSLDEQTTYFTNKGMIAYIDQANFQRIEGFNFIAVNMSIDDLWGTNYLMFKNASYNNKWFYAFVTKLEYKQHNTTYVHFEIDVLQTWMFDMTFKPSFVVREHCPLWNSDGSPVINTVDEGLHYGTEYNIVDIQNYRPCDDVYFLVACSKQAMHTGMTNTYYASINGLPQILVYYVHPFKLDGSVPGCNLGSLGGIGDFLEQIYTNTSAVNNIVSLYVTDCLPNNPTNTNGSLSFDSNNYSNVTIGSCSTIFVTQMDYSTWTYDAGSKYVGYTTPTESKLFMYPYTLVELVDFRGNKQVYKNEYIANDNLLISIQSSLGTQNKTAYSIKDYRTSYLADDNDKIHVSLENGLVNNEPNTVPVLTDLLSAYLQGNWNSIQNQKAQITFNGVLAGVGAFTNTAASVMSDNPIGAVSGIESGVRGAGNMALQMQGLQAKQHDIANVPPGLASLGNNSYFDYGNKYTGIYIIKKEIMPEYQKKLADYFNMFGYKLNEVKVPNFHTRQNWNYVETKNCIITGNFNNDDLNELKSIFDGGITLWHTDDVGNYSLSNGVIA